MKKYANILASLLYLGMLAVGLYHTIVVAKAWPGFTERANLLEYGLAPLWMLSIASLWLSRDWLLPFRFLAPFTAVVHGISLSQGGGNVGRFFILGGLLAAACTVRGQLWESIQASSLHVGETEYRRPRLAA